MASRSTDPTWGHRWGFADTRFVRNDDDSVILTGNRYELCGYKMHDFLPYVREVLGLDPDFKEKRQEVDPKPVPAPIKNGRFCRRLPTYYRPNQFTFDDRERLVHSHGQTSADEVFRVIYSRLDRVADMVVYPEAEKDCAMLVALARTNDVCLVPYGGGTSVSCALKLPASEKRMIVSVDMSRMNRVEWIDRENQRALVQAGITGEELERRLGEAGYVSGHEPDSIELSTLGGWIATHASGMKKNRYGNIEDIVEKVMLITPTGRVEHLTASPRVSMGMQPQNLFFGSEGNLGLITSAVIKIHPLPQVRKYGSLVFPDFAKGVSFLRSLTETSFVPASIRLVDNVQFRFGQALKPRATGSAAWLDKLKKFFLLKVKGFDPHQMSAATILMEGSHEEVSFQESGLYKLAKKYGGLPGGAENGRRGYRLTFAIAYIRDFLSDFHILGETFETSVSWDRIHQVCDAVVAGALARHQELDLPGRPYVSYRITQVYHTGVCIYFMFGFYAKGVRDPETIFSQVEHSLRQSIIDAGGSISHHHGVGKLRSDFMKHTLSSRGIRLLKEIKRATDPHNIFGIRNNVLGD